MFNQSAGNLKLSSFSGSGSYSYGDSKNGKKDIDYNIDANVKYKVVTSLDQVGKNDHVMIISDKILDSTTGDALGSGNIPGQVSAVESGTIGKSGAGGFNSVALHELGHNLGLDHSSGGLMYPESTGSVAVTDNERGQIVARSGVGVDAKDGTYTQSKTNYDSYKKDAKTKAEEFIKSNVIR